MANPYTKLPGYQQAWLIKTGYGDEKDRLVLFDRRQSDPRAKDLYDNPWEVRHMLTGESRFYGRSEKGNAESEAAASAHSAMPDAHWWVKHK